MPKQGQFAKSSRIKKLNSFKVKSHQQGQVIKNDQLTDFLIVRFALTVKKRIPQRAQETTQRFLIEIADQLEKENGDLQKIVLPLLQDINSRVPWQFFKQLDPQWEKLQKFLQKEVPAVPLSSRLRVTNLISEIEFSQQVAQLLATKAAAITFLKQPQLAATMTKQTTRLLLPTIYHDNRIDWEKVAALLAPFSFEIDDSLDEATKQWLTELVAAE